MKKGWFLRVGNVGRGGQGGQPHLLATLSGVGFCITPVGVEWLREFCRYEPCVAKLVFGDTVPKLFTALDLE
jgi:hypothetical protein